MIDFHALTQSRGPTIGALVLAAVAFSLLPLASGRSGYTLPEHSLIGQALALNWVLLCSTIGLFTRIWRSPPGEALSPEHVGARRGLLFSVLALGPVLTMDFIAYAGYQLKPNTLSPVFSAAFVLAWLPALAGVVIAPISLVSGLFGGRNLGP